MSVAAQQLCPRQFFLQQRLNKSRQTKQLCELLKEPVEFKDASSKCKECGQFTVRFRLVQNRGRDEGESTKSICSNCDET